MTVYMPGSTSPAEQPMRGGSPTPPSPGTEVSGLAARVAVLEEHSPMGTVVYANKFLDRIPLIYANPTEALEAAMAATDTYGGVVMCGEVWPQYGTMVGELTFPGKPIELWGNLRGTVPGGTMLYWPVDSGAGPTYAIRRPDGIRSVIRHMSILGPVNAVIDGALAGMYGIQQLSGHGLENLHVQGFRGGIARSGNHSWMRDIASKGNGYGVYLMGMAMAGVDTMGNSDMSAPMQLDGNSRGGIGVGPSADAGAFGERWSGIHFGMGPCAIYFEVDASNNAGNIIGVVIDTAAFENVGNCIAYSESVSPLGGGLLLATVINSMYSQYPGTTALAPTGFRAAGIRNNRAQFDGLAGVNLTMTDSDMLSQGVADTPLLMQHSGYCSLDIRGRYARQTLESMQTANGRLYANPNNFVTQRVTFEENYDRAEMHYCNAVGIPYARLVYRSAEEGVSPWAVNREVYGVTLQVGTAYEFIPIGRRGIWTVDNSATGALAIGDRVKPDAVTADGKVTLAGPGDSSIGVCMTAAAANAPTRVEFSL